MYFGSENTASRDDNSAVNFKEIFQKEDLSIHHLLSIKNILQEVKTSGDDFSHLLVKKPELIKAFIDGALRPQSHGITQVEHSYLCCEIIAAQTEVFHQFIFGPEEIQQEDVVQSEENNYLEGKKIFLYLFTVLDSNEELNSTVGGYLLKMFSQLQYQNPQAVFDQFVFNRQLFAKCLKHLTNPSVTQILTRVVCTYGQNLSKSPEKVKLAKEILIYPFITQLTISSICQILENLLGFAEEIVQKSSEFSQFICKQLISTKIFTIISQFIQKKKEHPEVLKLIADLLSILVHYHIKQEVKEKKKPKYFMDIEDETQKKQLREIDIGVLSLISAMARTIFKYIKDFYPTSACSLLSDIGSINNNTDFFFLDEGLFANYRQLFQKNPCNNILHNHLKKIIISGIKAKKFQFLPEIIQLINNALEKNLEYKNQMYHIAMQINNNDIPGSSNIFENIEKWKHETHKLYTLVIPEGQPSSTKKSRALNDFFGDQQEIHSEEEDLSSEDRSPKNMPSLLDDIPEILIHSDDDRQKQKNSVQSLQNEQKFGRGLQVKSVQIIKSNQAKVGQGHEKQKKQQNLSSLQNISASGCWKKVLYYSLDTLLSDLSNS